MVFEICFGICTLFSTIHPLKTFESVVDSLSTPYSINQCLIRRSPVSPVSLMPLRTIGPSIPENPDLELSSSSNKDDSQASSSPLPMVSSDSDSGHNMKIISWIYNFL